MQEREIDFRFNENNEPVEINKDELAKKVDKAIFALGYLKELRQKDKLEKGFCATMCTNIESYTRDLLNALDYDSQLERDTQERVQKIRAVNLENRELRKQLGEKVSSEDVRECLKNIEKTIREWWREEGFGHISSIEFHEYYIMVKLSGMISGSLGEDGAIDKLRKKGYEVVSESRSDGWMGSSDKNINLLQRELKRRFPSAIMEGVKCYFQKDGTGKIRSATFYIKDYDDVLLESMQVGA